ncbi:glycogen-binding subunit 76A isoform X2 [Bacillus rossius redtenbacheri]
MSSDREACGLGSIIPMSCRGRAEAFARRLHSRLQTLGRPGPGLDESSDESSWIGRQSSVTSCQPRLSSSSDSDIFFDFDLESSGSPEEEEPPPPARRHPQDVDSGSALSLSTTERTSPVSEGSSDERYFDPDSSDCEGSRSEAPGEPGNKSKCPEGPALCNGHIPNHCAEHPSPRSTGGHRLDSSSATERHNKINTSRFGDLNTEEKNNCGVNHRITNCKDLPAGLPSTNQKHAELVSDSGDKEKECALRESFCKTDNDSQGTATAAEIEDDDDNPTPTNEFARSNNIHAFNGMDDCILSDESGCLCRANSLEDLSLEDEHIGENCTDVSAEVGEDGKSSRSDVDSAYCCSSFVRPKNLLIDCSISNSEIEQLSSLVPLRIDSDAGVTSGVESVPEDSVERPKNTDDEDEEEEDEEKDSRPRRVRRSSSLKSGKTPPGTPGRKKIVRFADVLGLDLADVRTFLDEVPRVPQSAYQDLLDVDLSVRAAGAEGVLLPSLARQPDRCLVPMFQQPGAQADFLDKVRERQVCLESAVVTDATFFTVSGVVRVRNLDFHKSVYVRYTLDGWRTFSDLQASYVDGSCDGFSDKFSFKLYAHTVGVGGKVEFAVRFQCRGLQYWDSNLGANYTFQCLPPVVAPATSLPLASPVDTWTASFY